MADSHGRTDLQSAHILEEAAQNGKRSKRIIDEIPEYLCKRYNANPRIFRKGYSPKLFPEFIRKVYDYCQNHNLNPVIDYVPYMEFDGIGGGGYYYLDVSW